MKTKLLFFTLFFVSVSFSQTPINSFYTEDNTVYKIVTSTTPLDQTAIGANINWNFDQLSLIGTNTITNATPTASELTTYPETSTISTATSVTTTGTTIEKVFSKNIANTVSITGLITTNLEINFITNNGTIGNFPMNFGDSVVDTFAGTFIFNGTFNGTFTGASTTTVDAYGTLTANIGSFSPNTPVTRVKTVQTFLLSLGDFIDVGTAVQTTYNYYADNGFTAPVFKTVSNTIDVNQFGIHIENNQIDTFFSNPLEINLPDEQNLISIYPNPVKDIVNINASNIKKVSVYDLLGKKVIDVNCNCNEISLSELDKGFYILNINTDKGFFSEKFIKE